MSFAAIEQLLHQSMGLDAATVGASTIERAVADRMQACALATVDDYLSYLECSPLELQELTECVVVPETWFFRDEEAFAVLGRISAEWLLRHPASTMRALSVPCSTGEEPYSIAMTLHDAGLPRKQILVDAVDISARALARARRGVYGRNSFRSQNLAFREHHFKAVKEGYSVAEWLSQAVRFHQGNLVTAQFPFPVAPYDVIFCRNVLIYFDRPTQGAVMRTLSMMLGPQGVLFVGPAEAFLAGSCGFSLAGSAAGFAFTKCAAKVVVPAVLPIARPRRASPLLPCPAPKSPPSAKHDLSDISEARRLADEGRFPEAAACCERNLSLKPSAEAYCLLGVIRDAAGERELATDCFRRAIYLQPDHSEALAHLAIAIERQGDHAGAQRLRGRAHRAGDPAKDMKAVNP